MSEQVDQKSVNNAVIAYFLLGPLLLLNTSNKYINNSFVRGHAKTSSLLMLAMLVFFFFFKFFAFLGNYHIFGYNFYYLIKTIGTFAIFGAMVYGAMRAYNRKAFSIKEIPQISHTDHIVEFSKNTVHREQDKTSIILSYIPFVGYFLYPKFEKHPSIKSINKINLYSSLVIIFFYTSGRYNLATLLLLIYITYVCFTAIKLYVHDEIRIAKLEKLWNFGEMYVHAKAFILYIYNYSSRDYRFREYDLYLKIEKAGLVKQAKLMLKDLLPRKSIPFPKAVLYIPFVNLVGVFFLDTRYKTHIINGICIDIALILIWVFTGFNSVYSIFILFPISYGLAYRRKIDYKFPLIYDIAKIEMKAWGKAKTMINGINEKRKMDTEVVFTPKNNIKS